VPLYEFRCPACCATFEELAAPGVSPACPACGAEGAERQWSAVSPPARIGLHGRAKRDSDARRADREARRFS
jgi:putative FmdB family regulatory protein